MVPSKAEELLCRSLRTILAVLKDGESIGDSEVFQSVLAGLEFFLPQVLPGIFADSGGGILDGFCPVVAKKTGEAEAEIIGLCILISDQTLAPIKMRMQLALNKDEVSWLECKFGEPGLHGIERTPYAFLDKALHRMYEFCYLEGKSNMIEWVYEETVGRKRV